MNSTPGKPYEYYVKVNSYLLRYMYPDDPKDLGKTLSGAKYVEDVNEVGMR